MEGRRNNGTGCYVSQTGHQRRSGGQHLRSGGIRIHDGLWDYKLNWHNNYPEGDVAEIKWLLRQSVINYYYLKKYNLVETN